MIVLTFQRDAMLNVLGLGGGKCEVLIWRYTVWRTNIRSGGQFFGFVAQETPLHHIMPVPYKTKKRHVILFFGIFL